VNDIESDLPPSNKRPTVPQHVFPDASPHVAPTTPPTSTIPPSHPHLCFLWYRTWRASSPSSPQQSSTSIEDRCYRGVPTPQGHVNNKITASDHIINFCRRQTHNNINLSSLSLTTTRLGINFRRVFRPPAAPEAIHTVKASSMASVQSAPGMGAPGAGGGGVLPPNLTKEYIQQTFQV